MGYSSDGFDTDFDSSDAACCVKHLLDESLIERVAGKFDQDECTFCDAAGPGVAIEVDELLELGMEKVHVEFTSAANYGAGLESFGIGYEDGGYDTGEALSSIYEGSLDDEVLEEVRSCGNDQTWVPESLLYLDEQQRMSATWEAFVETVKHHRRFWFIDQTSAVSDPEKLPVSDFFERVAGILARPELTKDWPRESAIWRGRMVPADEDPAKFDGKELGSPPVDYAAANRMSPAGVSMFYGGDTPDVVIAEIGAHSTYNHAIYGSFTTLKDLRIIDLTELPAPPGYFAAENEERLALQFLKDFVADLVKPVILDGREHIDYVPTQIVTEYLRYYTEPEVHGLRFSSSQHPGGINTVLFCGPKRCVNPPGGDLNQDGWPPSEAHESIFAGFPQLTPWLQFDPDSLIKTKTRTAIAAT